MSIHAADALMPVFGLKRTTVMVWDLTRGDRFTVEGCDTVWTFKGMDGAYCYAYNESGKVLNWSGPVVRVEG
jgi:hypothetical protein